MFYPPIMGYLVILLVGIGLASASSRGRLTRNPAIGIRTKHTLRSDAAWDAGQRAAVPYLVAMGVIAAGHSIALLAVELTDAPESLGHILAVTGYLLILAAVMLAWRAADAAAKRSL